ncbi:MAG: ABC transporter permease, partial [Deltaproteobacteria bacterium]|nr:ABC transporter permease [Deltaproteobacteria bacterium]
MPASVLLVPLQIEESREQDALVLRLDGSLDTEGATQLTRAVARAARRRSSKVVLALDNIKEADSFGIAALAESLVVCERRGCTLEARGIGEDLRARLSRVPAPRPREKLKPIIFLERWGDGIYGGLSTFAAFLQLLADTAYWTMIAPLQRRLPPPGATTDQAVRIGLDAGPIVMLVGFLMGLIMAFQAAYQLRQFGANIYVANLVGLAMVRELGPLMTAIIVAGRSGSAIAAELGTMTVGEEIDALKTMGIDPIRFLVVPRVYAISISQPALSLFSMTVGILGGFLIGVFFLDLSAAAYLKQTISAIHLSNLLEGLGKSLAFSWLIVMIGC